MIVKCYSLYDDSFASNVDKERLTKIMIKNKLVLDSFDKRNIHFPMLKAKFDPAIFTEIFRIIPDITFEVVFCKSEKVVKVMYFAKDKTHMFSSIEKGRKALFPIIQNREQKHMTSLFQLDERSPGTTVSFYK